MKLILASLLALSATPALAQSTFTGIRGEIVAGVNDITRSTDRNDVNYGAGVGFDIPVGSKFIAGIEATADNAFEKQHQIGVSARLGYILSPRWMAYGKAGYDNYNSVGGKNLDGLRLGGGLEYSITPHTYVKAEYRYSDFQNHVGSHGALAGVGVRF